MRRTLILSLAVATLATALPALADHGPEGRHGHRGHGPGHGMAIEHLSERLDLSEAQRAELEELHAARREATGESVRALTAARRTLADAIHADAFDEGAIRAAAAEVARLEADRAVERAEHLQAMRRILTPEQWSELETMRSERPRRGLRQRLGPAGRGPAPPTR